jgi:hypothetical protein
MYAHHVVHPEIAMITIGVRKPARNASAIHQRARRDEGARPHHSARPTGRLHAAGEFVKGMAAGDRELARGETTSLTEARGPPRR